MALHGGKEPMARAAACPILLHPSPGPSHPPPRLESQQGVTARHQAVLPPAHPRGCGSCGATSVRASSNSVPSPPVVLYCVLCSASASGALGPIALQNSELGPTSVQSSVFISQPVHCLLVVSDLTLIQRGVPLGEWHPVRESSSLFGFLDPM